MGKKFDRVVLLDDDVRGKVHKLISRNVLKFYDRFLVDPDSFETSVIAYVGQNLMKSADVYTGKAEKLALTLPMPTSDNFPTDIAVALLAQIKAQDKTVLLLCDQTWSFIKEDGVEDRDDLAEHFLDAFTKAKEKVNYKKIVAIFYSSLSNYRNNLPKGCSDIEIVQNTVADWRWEDILSSLKRIQKVLTEDRDNA